MSERKIQVFAFLLNFYFIFFFMHTNILNKFKLATATLTFNLNLLQDSKE